MLESIPQDHWQVHAHDPLALTKVLGLPKMIVTRNGQRKLITMYFRRYPAFTLVELLVVIAILSILAALLFPIFAQSREKARQATCLSNTRQLCLATLQYVQDHDETFPMAYGFQPGNGWLTGEPGDSPPSAQYAPGTPQYAAYAVYWGNAIQPYVRSYQVFACPSATVRDANFSLKTPTTAQMTYTYNGVLQSDPLAGITSPTALPLVTESIGNVFIAGRQLANPQLVCANTDSPCIYQPATSGCSAGVNGQKSIMLIGPSSLGVHGQGQTFAYVDGHSKYKPLSFTVMTPAQTNRNNEPWAYYKPGELAGAVWKDINNCHVDFFRPDNTFQNM
jgi:prepilin-type N-terminal cleavage/methylation domain-containing protein